MSKTRQPKGFFASPNGLQNLQAKKLEKAYSQETIRKEAQVTLDQVKRLFNPHWSYKIGREAIESIARVLDLHPREIVGGEWDSPIAIPQLEQAETAIDWKEICNKMLEPQRRLSSNCLLHAEEDGKFERKQIYVPLALVERKKSDKRDGGGIPEAGTKLYEPQYEEKQRFEHEAFLQQILAGGEGKTKGKQIAIIGEPGAGKTTLLQAIADWVLEQEDLGLAIWISLADLGQNGTLNIWDYLQSNWLSVATSPTHKDIARTELLQHLEQGRVWLLLDGVDEVATSGIQTLQSIANQLRGWLAQSRVILTCRLNVWEADKNALTEFETYRLLDFDYPQQVHQFIDNWFSNDDAEKKKRLKAELDNTEKARLCDLIQNPLRLTLLCASWQSQEGKLPETKAGLYAQFVEQFYKWKCDRFPITYEEKRLLNQALGRLALQDIDTGNTRFRLREGFIREAIGNDTLFEKALQLGWLNNVGIAAESPTQEKVYAFFHASFEEYFAALAIDDWHYFLNHNNEQPSPFVKYNNKDCVYRIFKPQWKQVILIWLGRDEMEKEQKEAFIQKLAEFDSGCNNFYAYQAYFLAAAGVAEFRNCTRADKLVAGIINYGFSYFDIKQQQWVKFFDLVIQETDRTKAIAALIELIGTTESYYTFMQAVLSLGEIGSGNPDAINALIELIGTTEDEYTRRQVVSSLGKIGSDNSDAINALMELISTTKDEDTRRQAVSGLGRIGSGNPDRINALIELIGTTENYYTRMQAAESLGKIGFGNSDAIAALIELIGSTKDENTRRQAAESLGKIGSDNPDAITALIKLIGSTKDENTCRQAAESLGKIGSDNPDAIAGLIKLISTTENENTRRQVISSFGKIGSDNPDAIAGLIKLIGSTKDENTRRQAAESLGKIGSDNPDAIAGLIKLISTTENENTRRQAVSSLGKIGSDNSDAINALIELISTTKDENTCRQAVLSFGKIGSGNPDAINALIELIGSTENYYTRMQAAESLGKIGFGNSDAIAALIELIGSTKDENTRRQAVSSLGKIGSGNSDAIAALIELIGSTKDENTRRQAVSSLGKIGSGNPDAIAALIELIGSTKDEDTRRQAVSSLGKIGSGNPDAIADLIKLISTTENEYTRRQVVLSLGEIGSDNSAAINALIELINTTEDEYTRRHVAESLGKIGSDNSAAINALIELINTTEDEYTRRQAVSSFGKIGSDNSAAIAGLIELICTNKDKDIRSQAAKSLEKILAEEQMAGVVTVLKNYLSNSTSEQMGVIWHCAQNMPYPEFYQAWHNPRITSHPEVPETTTVGFTPTVQSLDRQITDICTQINTFSCICINAQTLADITNPTEIAQEICNQIFLKLSPDGIPEVTNAPQLKRHLIALRHQTPNLALILHNGDPETALLKFCRQITDILPIGWITNAPLEFPLRGFPPQQPNLLSAIESWLEEVGT